MNFDIHEIMDKHFHMHDVMWFMVAVIIFAKFKSFWTFIIAVFSEKNNEDGTPGKPSGKRFVTIMYSFTPCYVWIYSMHSGKEVNIWVYLINTAFVAFSLAILSPDQFNLMISNLKGLVPGKKTDSTPQKEANQNG